MHFALALGGGGLKGVAHLGVLKVLVENGLCPDLVVGTSAGSLAAALFCSGKLWSIRSPKEISLMDVELRSLLQSWFVLPKDVRVLESILKKLLGQGDFSSLKVPMAAVASDLYSGSTVFYSSLNPSRPLPPQTVWGGNIPVWQAVRASISLPGIFAPVAYGPHLLVDGGVTDNVPADVARFLGAKVVVAVDLGLQNEPMSFRHAWEIVWRCLEITGSYLTTQTLSRYSDLVLSPLRHLKRAPGFWEIHRIPELLDAGMASAREALPKIRQLLEAPSF